MKCDRLGTVSIKKTTSRGHVYQYYYIQHYDSETRKRKWCLGKYDSLPPVYKTIIHKPEGLYTNYTQIEAEENNFKLSSIQENNTNSVSGCGLAWSRTGAPQAPDPGSNPGCRTKEE